MATFPINTLAPVASRVTFTGTMMVVHLTDGREIRVPLTWFPRLHATPVALREQWEMMGGGVGIHWEEADEDISVPRLLGLPCD